MRVRWVGGPEGFEESHGALLLGQCAAWYAVPKSELAGMREKMGGSRRPLKGFQVLCRSKIDIMRQFDGQMGCQARGKVACRQRLEQSDEASRGAGRCVYQYVDANPVPGCPFVSQGRRYLQPPVLLPLKDELSSFVIQASRECAFSGNSITGIPKSGACVLTPARKWSSSAPEASMSRACGCILLWIWTTIR